MENNENQPEVIQYQTSGTCCRMMYVAIQDNKIVDSEFIGGCHGNLQGIKSLIKGADIDEVISKLQGIRCGDKDTSCPDQLSKCLIAYKKKKQAASA